MLNVVMLNLWLMGKHGNIAIETEFNLSRLMIDEFLFWLVYYQFVRTLCILYTYLFKHKYTQESNTVLYTCNVILNLYAFITVSVFHSTSKVGYNGWGPIYESYMAFGYARALVFYSTLPILLYNWLNGLLKFENLNTIVFAYLKFSLCEIYLV